MLLKVWVSPLAPVLWMEVGTSTGAAVQLSLNTTVQNHFWDREANGYNTSFALPTLARCSGGGTGGAAVVTRDSDYAGSNAFNPHAVTTGAIHNTIRTTAPTTCTVTDATSTTLTFTAGGGSGSGGDGGAGDGSASTTTVQSVIRTTKDPACVALPQAGAAPSCDLSTTDAAAAAAAIAEAVLTVPVPDAKTDHNEHWAAFWNVSSISLPNATDTEDFWFGAQYVANSAIPHVGQEQTPPGLYGPWGTTDNPGWHGDYTIDYNYEAIFYGVMSSNHPEMMLS